MVSGANGRPETASRADFPVLSLREGAPLGENGPNDNPARLPGDSRDDGALRPRNALPAMEAGNPGGTMRHIAIHIKELTSSNLNSLVGSAANPLKMLRLLQSELQEAVIALQGDFSRAQRQAERLETGAAQLTARAAEWTAKARTAMDHKREDLARAALLTREQTQADAERMAGEARAMAAQAGEIGEVIAELEAKLSETRERIGAEAARSGQPSQPAAGAAATRGERIIDRISTLEKRVDFAAQKRPDPAPAAIDEEIERLAREARVGEELAAMKAAAKPAPAKKKAKR
jgi:phage shock protein A